MQQYLLDTSIETKLFDDVMIEAWIGRVGTSGRDNMCDLRQVTTPLLQCLSAGLY